MFFTNKGFEENQAPENKRDIDLDGWDLHRAGEENRPDITLALLVRGDNIQAKDEDGDSPLHLAVWKESLDVARLLIEKGANTDGIDLNWMENQ